MSTLDPECTRRCVWGPALDTGRTHSEYRGAEDFRRLGSPARGSRPGAHLTTPTPEATIARLDRGGVIGGSFDGASARFVESCFRSRSCSHPPRRAQVRALPQQPKHQLNRRLTARPSDPLPSATRTKARFRAPGSNPEPATSPRRCVPPICARRSAGHRTRRTERGYERHHAQRRCASVRPLASSRAWR